MSRHSRASPDFRRRTIASGAILAWLLAASSWKVFGQQYPFLPVAGSPKVQANLFQDSRGRLWMGGTKPACFDGTRFFFLRDYGLPEAQVFDFSEDTAGTLWIAAETGVYRFVNGRIGVVSEGAAESVAAITPDVAIAVRGRGRSINAPLIRIQLTRDGWKTQTVMNIDSSPLSLDSSGMFLYPWPGKGWSEVRLEDVLRWQPGDQISVIRHPMAGFPGSVDLKVMRDHSGCTWWSGGDIEDRYDCGKGSYAAPFEGANLHSTMREGPDGRMVLLGDSLLAVGRPGAFRIATRANGLPTPVDAVLGRDGTVWLTGLDGLYRLASPFRIEYWTIRDGLTDTPWSIARSGKRVYAGLYRRIVALSEDRARWSTLATFKEGTLVAGLLNAEQDGLVAALKDGGVVQLSATGQVVARTEKDRPKGGMRLERTPDGGIWVGQVELGRLTRNGKILKFEDHPLQTQPSRTVLAIKYEQRTRRLWACYNGGLVERDEHGTWKEFTRRDGLLDNGCWALAPLPNGDVWHGYFGIAALALIRPLPTGGLFVRQYGPDTGIPEPGGITLDIDQHGWLWRGGGIGLYVANESEAEDGKWLQLDQSDGFPAGGMNSGSVFVDQDDSLWWGANTDLVHYVPPSDLVAPKFAPQVFVSAFSWENQPPKLAEAVGGVPHGSKIVAHVGSLQFDRRNALRLRYRLLPDQNSWRETTNLDVVLGSLTSGTHTLEVQGRVFTGPWSASASQAFTVLRPVWLGWPFLVSYLIAVPSIAFGGYLLHRRRSAEIANLLPDLADWRAAALLMDGHVMTGAVLEGRFEAGALLSRGDFADVMDGQDREKRERCAIKIFRSETSDVNDKAWIEHRFEQEVIALERVHHPNVVRIYAHGTTDTGLPYLVMEFIDGVNLRDVLRNGALAPDRVARFLRQLASALDGIHAHGICHRDVKPDNIIVRSEGSSVEEIVLIDFSTAIVKDVDRTSHGLSRAIGTRIYMAPEQALGHAQPASDVYSLAKVTIEMLTGRSLAELLPDATIDLADHLPEVLATLPIRFSAASVSMLTTALAFDPRLRPNAAGAFAEPIVSDLASGPFQKR